jgi:hypothetical protein
VAGVFDQRTGVLTDAKGVASPIGSTGQERCALLRPAMAKWQSDNGARGFKRASDIQIEDQAYVWQRRLVAGAINLIAGPSKVGKSTLACHLAARLTQGDLSGKPEDVIMLLTEDSYARLTVPRFMVAGGDPKRLHVPDNDKRWSLPRDLDMLRDAITDTGARVVFLDPLQGIVPGLSSQAGREALDLIHEVAEATGTAIVLLCHFVKAHARAKKVEEAIAGGYGVYGIARSIHVFGWEPVSDADRLFRKMTDGRVGVLDDDEDDGDPPDDDDPPGERLILAHEKISGEARQPSLLLVRSVVPSPTGEIGRTMSLLTEVREVDMTPLVVAQAGDPDTPAERKVGRDVARELALKVIAEASEDGVSASDLMARMTAAGISERTVVRARGQLADEGMICDKQVKNDEGRTVEWRWHLVVPDAPPLA